LIYPCAAGMMTRHFSLILPFRLPVKEISACFFNAFFQRCQHFFIHAGFFQCQSNELAGFNDGEFHSVFYQFLYVAFTGFDVGNQNVHSGICSADRFAEIKKINKRSFSVADHGLFTVDVNFFQPVQSPWRDFDEFKRQAGNNSLAGDSRVQNINSLKLLIGKIIVIVHDGIAAIVIAPREKHGRYEKFTDTASR